MIETVKENFMEVIGRFFAKKSPPN